MWFARRISGVIAIVFGALLVAMPFALSLPAKTADADQMNANLKPVYTQQMIDQAGGALTTVGAMGTEMSGTMLPALAGKLRMTGDQLQTFLGSNFPATAAALQNMPASMGRFQGLVGTFDANLQSYETMKPVSFAPIIWTAIFGGALMLVMGIWAFVAGRTPKVTVLQETKPASQRVGAAVR